MVMKYVKTEANTNVLLDKKTKKPITLKEICERVKINQDNINIDSLNVQVNYIINIKNLKK